MTKKPWIEKALDQVDAHTSDTLFNVVGVDDFAMAGDDDALYLVSQHDNAADAEISARDHTAKTGDKAHVYPPQRPLAASPSPPSTVRVAAQLPDGTAHEVAPMTHAAAAEAMRQSPGGAVRVLFDPRTQTAEEIVAQMHAIRIAARRAAGFPDDPDPVGE